MDRIIELKWWDKVTNSELVERAKQVPMILEGRKRHLS